MHSQAWRGRLEAERGKVQYGRRAPSPVFLCRPRAGPRSSYPPWPFGLRQTARLPLGKTRGRARRAGRYRTRGPRRLAALGLKTKTATPPVAWRLARGFSASPPRRPRWTHPFRRPFSTGRLSTAGGALDATLSCRSAQSFAPSGGAPVTCGWHAGTSAALTAGGAASPTPPSGHRIPPASVRRGDQTPLGIGAACLGLSTDIRKYGERSRSLVPVVRMLTECGFARLSRI